MLCNKQEEGMEAGSKVDKFKMFKKQQGVYVGKMARSIFERAKEHHHDAQEKSEESHRKEIRGKEKERSRKFRVVFS